MNEIIYKIENIVKKCGELILTANEQDMNIDIKEGCGNIVTAYDKKIQEFLKGELLKIIPESIFIGEEEESHKNILDTGYTFIVDPIDGTTNFSRSLNISAISVGLLKDGQPYIGICYNPYTDEMFIAEKGKGAYLNGKSIHVSKKRLSDGLILAGNAPYYSELREQSLNIQRKLSLIATDYRRLGSAVIGLCYVACGRAEVYFELKLQPWDYAAGVLIVEESGGKVTTISGEKLEFNGSTSILASNNTENYFKYIKN